MMKYVEKSGSNTHSVGYTYDSLNNLTALKETFGDTVRKFSYAYDGDNRPTSITAGNSFLGYAYDAYGRVSKLTTKHDGTAFATKTYTYKSKSNGAPTNQVSTVTVKIGSNSTIYSYTYDKNGNITEISDGTHTTRYTYDSANQLIREDNQTANTTTVWTYDNAGNILTRTAYPYTTGTVGTGTETAYTYSGGQWGDLLTAYGGQTISYDGIGNPLNDGTWSYTWKHGRQLASMSKLDQSETWQFTYNADGLRTQRTNGTRTYQYTYTGDKLTHMTVDGHTMYFTYDASGTPLTMVYDGHKFYYVTNLQGDVISIINGNGQEFVHYTYDAWGNILSVEGSAENLRYYNPLRYRGYVYDPELEMYYLQSRYYDPQIGRFVNADDVSFLGITGTTVGYNLFSYCENSPISNTDTTGYWAEKYSGFKLEEKGFNVNVQLCFLSRPFCLAYAYDAIKLYCEENNMTYRSNSKLDGMSAKRIAQELWFHALVYYVGSPIKAVLRKINVSIKKLDEYITSASYMQINSDDKRALAFSLTWLAASAVKSYIKQAIGSRTIYKYIIL